MNSKFVQVEYRYSRRDLDSLFRVARAYDVEKGGRYDARAAAINVWSHTWMSEELRKENEPVCSFYVSWGDEIKIR